MSFGQHIQFNFEFKDYIHEWGEDFAKESADRAIAMIDEYGLWDRSFFNSFDGRLLEYAEEKYNGRFRLHGFYPFEICKNTKARLYCACLFNQHWINGVCVEGKEAVNPKKDFDALKSFGVRPWVGAGIQREEDVLNAIECGAELFTSDDPRVLMEILKKNGYR